MFYIVPKARSSVRLKRAHTVQRLHVGHLTNTYSILVRFTLSLFIFSVRLLPVLRGHSVFSSSPQRPMTSDFEGFLIPDFIHIHLNYSERASISLLMLSAKQRNYWYHFYNVFGMTRGLNPGHPALEARTIPLGYRGGGTLDFVSFVIYVLVTYCKKQIVKVWLKSANWEFLLECIILIPRLCMILTEKNVHILLTCTSHVMIKYHLISWKRFGLRLFTRQRW